MGVTAHQVKFVTWKKNLRLFPLGFGDWTFFAGKRRYCRDDKWHILFPHSILFAVRWICISLLVDISSSTSGCPTKIPVFDNKTKLCVSIPQLVFKFMPYVYWSTIFNAWRPTIRTDFAEMEGPCQRMIIRFDTSVFASRPLFLHCPCFQST